MKYTEFFVVVCTLTAIISTFFLYRNHAGPLHMVAATIDALPRTQSEGQPRVMGELSRHAESNGAIPNTEPETSDTETKSNPSTIPDAALVAKIGTPGINSIPVVDASYQYSFQTLATAIHSRTNISRSQNNLPALAYDKTLAHLAELRSQDMAKNDYFSHITQVGCDLACRFKASQYLSLTWGENLAEFSDYTAQNETELAKLFINKWVASSEHRDNLFSKAYNREGVGVAIKDKRIVVTVIFAKQ